MWVLQREEVAAEEGAVPEVDWLRVDDEDEMNGDEKSSN